jgi:hypothetical protein
VLIGREKKGSPRVDPGEIEWLAMEEAGHGFYSTV